ncbi:MAG: NAD(P)/FAD-dependent oxidoreductase [Sphingomonadales bacterium]
MEKKYWDVIIIGAGAAGLMCAIEAGKRGRRTLLLDHAKIIGEKIRISGGGRCNFTNLKTLPQNFTSQNPHFCKSALARYTPQDFIKLVETYSIKFYEKTMGQLFCEDSAQQIINMLLDECKNFNVKIELENKIGAITKTKTGFRLGTRIGQINCTSLVIATGGKSIPKIGATGFGYTIAKDFNLNIIKPRPGLVPLTFDESTRDKNVHLAGVSLNVEVSSKTGCFKEALLFTHRGISGPAILQISSFWQEGEEITINLCPDINILDALTEAKTKKTKQTILRFLATILPNSLAQYHVQGLGFHENLNLVELSNKQLGVLSNAINSWTLKPQGNEGFRKAEVTLGGVDTKELSSKTFEAKKAKGLYFIGEVVDVTGHLGGHNFQWAWASGHAAGQFV